MSAAANYRRIIQGWVNTFTHLRRPEDYIEPERIADELLRHLKKIPEISDAVEGRRIDSLIELSPSAFKRVIKRVPPRLLLDIQRDTLNRMRGLGTRLRVELLVLEGEGSGDNTKKIDVSLSEGGDVASSQYILMRTYPTQIKPRTIFFPSPFQRSSKIVTPAEIHHPAKKPDPLLEIQSPAVSITTYAFTPYHHIPLQSGTRLSFGPLQAGFIQAGDLIEKSLDTLFPEASPVDILIIGGTQTQDPENSWAAYFDKIQASQLQPLLAFVPGEHGNIAETPSFTMLSLGDNLAIYAHVVFDPLTQMLDLFLHRTATGRIHYQHHVNLDRGRRIQQLLGNREAIVVLRQTMVDYINAFPAELALSKAIEDMETSLPFAVDFILDRETNPYHEMSVVKSGLKKLRVNLGEAGEPFGDGGGIERTFERWIRRWNPEKASPKSQVPSPMIRRQPGSLPPDRSRIEQEIKSTLLPKVLRSNPYSKTNRCFYKAVRLVGLIECIPQAKITGEGALTEIQEEWHRLWLAIAPSQIRTMTHCFVTLMNAWMQEP